MSTLAWIMLINHKSPQIVGSRLAENQIPDPTQLLGSELRRTADRLLMQLIRRRVNEAT